MSKKTNTVEYFPHYANASGKMTVLYLEKKYGYKGYALWFKLLECLASTENHYLCLDLHLHLLYLTCRLVVDNNELMVILNDLSDIDAIDKNLWQQYKIIWSDNFVANLSTVYANRHRELPSKPNINNVSLTPPNPTPTNNLQLTNNEPTNISRVEEVEEVERSRVEEVKNSKEKKDINIKKISLEEFTNNLKVEFPKLDVDKEITACKVYYQEKGKEIKRPMTAYRNWLVKAMEFKGNGHGTNQINSQESDGKPTDKFTSGKYGHLVNQ
jgi:hypothetical protein